MLCLNERLRNTLYLGLCFIILFSAFNALGNVQKTISSSIQKENPAFSADAYTSFGIVYFMFAVLTWLSPGVLAKTGPKYAMVLGTACYVVFIGSFYFENNISVYVGSATCGIGASILWNGQANYIVLNSEFGKVYSGIGLFWILYESSHFFGNAMIYLQFADKTKTLDRTMRVRIIAMNVGLILLSMFLMLFIKPPMRNKGIKPETRNSLKEIAKSYNILKTPHMLLLLVTMIFTGMNLTYLSIMSASMSFSKYLSENSKELAPLCGLFEGVGEIVGGLLSIFIGGKSWFKLRPVLTVGCTCNILAYIIALLMLPNSSTNTFTSDPPIVYLPTYLLSIASIFLGIGDACMHTEVYDFLGNLYPNDSSCVFAIYKCVRSLAVAASFYYGKFFGLHIQLIMLLISVVLSWISYHIVHLFLVKSIKSDITSSGLNNEIVEKVPK